MKTLYIVAPNKKSADKSFKTWTPEGSQGQTEWVDAFHPGLERAKKEISKELKVWADHIKFLGTPEGEAMRMEYAKDKCNGWGSWKADRIKKEIVAEIKAYQIFAYPVETFGDYFKRATP